MPTEQRLGILGGMGPQATQVFYQRILDLTDAARDQEHLPALILSDTAMPDRTAAILGGDAEGCFRRLLAGAKTLERCDCTAIAIPCNTSHYFADRLQAEHGPDGVFCLGFGGVGQLNAPGNNVAHGADPLHGGLHVLIDPDIAPLQLRPYTGGKDPLGGRTAAGT